VLEQDEAHVALGEARLAKRAHQEDVGVGAAGDGDALALEVGHRGDRPSLRVTSAVHSGRE
jgi:hypothetical protein